MFQQYLQYVKDYLLQNGGYYPPNPQYNFRSKYEHTLRVLKWCKVLVEDIPLVNQEVLYTAAIFHDVGYGNGEDKSLHAEESARVFEEYAKEQNMDIAFAEQVTYLIKMHSNKELLNVPDAMPELVLLMEADLLDEEGALRVIWYCATKAIQGADSYFDIWDFIKMGSNKRLDNPMVTPIAKKLWDQKINLVNQFQEELLKDINIDTSFL